MLAFIAALAACGRPSPKVPPAPSTPKAPSSVVDYAPSAGLRWLLYGRPARISADPALFAALGAILPKVRLDAYAASTGVDLRKLPEGLVAGYELGTLFVAKLDTADAELIRGRFASRLDDGGIVKRVRADIYRISGTHADTPLALVSVENRIVAMASGDLTLARIVEAYAERRIKSPTALRGAALSTLPAPADDALAAFFAPGPFTDESLVAAPRLLAATLAVGAVVRSRTPGMLAVTITLAGDWPPESKAREELESVWRGLSASSTGRLLGLDSAQNVGVEAAPELLSLSLELPIAVLVRGLRSLTVANVPEIFELNNATPPLPTLPHTDSLPLAP
ncbi:MAG TPA: hypothetical protein VGK73_32935 [Polyangiaceae bacterium]